MRCRVREILLVSSLYDSFILSEDGRLYEELLSEYIGLNLTHMPGLTRVSSGGEAIRMARELGRFNLIITTMRLEDMHALDFAEEVKKSKLDIPVVLLTYDSRELADLMKNHDLSGFEKVFMWQGDFRILLAIIKYIEDRENVDYDTHLVGVQSIILIEDNVHFYSSYLPMIYTQLMRHTQSLISEGVNPAHMLMRMRARPKILLCETYEEAWQYYERYHENTLGVISDIEFPHRGESDPEAGFEFARNVKSSHPDIPILLQSRDPTNKKIADEIGASFLLKDSPLLLQELEEFLKSNFSFGDFVFRMPDGTEVGRARDLKTLEEQLHKVPAESLLYHGERNHFSNWLKARTEFWLAHQLRPRKVTDYETVEDIRKYLITCLHALRIEQHRGIVVDYDPETFVEAESVARIGGGSLGGKGRGLGFASTLISTYQIKEKIEGVRILIPPSVVLGTDVFEQFLNQNGLQDFAINTQDDQEICRKFIEAPLPAKVIESLTSFVEHSDFPLSVRSSSLLEDSQYIPFAGVYQTYMIPNNHRSKKKRLEELLSTVKRVFASTYSTHAKRYIEPTPYRLEEEKMAVIIQKLVGTRHEDRFYPDFAGVARSYNFYPIPPATAADGIAAVALGLGRTVVEGGRAVRFCPKYPRHLVQFSTIEDTLNYSQRDYWVLELPSETTKADPRREFNLSQFGLDVAEADGTLSLLASTYSRENNAVYDGVSRIGSRVVTFAQILKNDYFPISEILELMLELGSRGMSAPVEIEFAVNLSVPSGAPKEFYLLQLRPMVVSHEREQVKIEIRNSEELICRSTCVLGNGVIKEIQDIVVVDANRFNRAESAIAAREVTLFNLELTAKNAPYILIGVGRWGSADPWLGIPVTWDDIWGARVIVESDLKDLKVTPSQGTHFFQNIIASKVGYFTVNTAMKEGIVDWDWLASQPAASEKKYTRHIHFDESLVVVMNGHTHEGIIKKPNRSS
ncbi:MAG: histidine kinase [Candidatus Latescibacteria bacterium]|nr:histidine kinase [Candidatus Latescibacterota bacterium]NIO00943.1 histidine kinase [Candidatus Latescibacterota bacterium]NIO27342.1 histidine kinase [Candidatus Latescibacterota bacterium]NIO54864.1 histidine kinase [Candidatus Latescibacterota bacterium]NIT00953.1 histidine kinase [Candidatus Latescibacterota bacterium]